MTKGRLTWILGATLLVVWGSYRAYTGVSLEDAQITFRHAENLAAGMGFGFNPGTWVQGSTTPLLTLVLAVVAWMVGPSAVAGAASMSGILAGIATLPPTVDLLARWRCHPAVVLAASLGWLLTPRVVWSGVGGMETAWVTCFMAWSLWAAEFGRGRAMGLALALLVLTRPDGLLWTTLLGAATFRRRELWWQALPFVIPVAAWAFWATWAFGHPVPHSIVAKSVVNPKAGSLLAYGPILARFGWISAAWTSPFPASTWIGVPLCMIGSLLALRRGLPGVAAAFVLALPGALHLGRAPLFLWYPVPAAWTASLLGALAVQRLLVALGRTRWAWTWPLWVGMSGLLALRQPAHVTREEQQNEAMRAAVGQWIDAHAPPRASIAMEAIGYQGTRARRRVVDLAGLVSPEVVAIARKTDSNAARFAQVLSQEAPWAVVLREWEVRRNRHFHGGPLFADNEARTRFTVRYVEAARFEAPHPARMGRNHTIVIYVRRARPASR